MRLRSLVAAAAATALPLMLGGVTASASSTVPPASAGTARVSPAALGGGLQFWDANGVGGGGARVTFALHGHAHNFPLDTESLATAQAWTLVPTGITYDGNSTDYLNLTGTNEYANFDPASGEFYLDGKAADLNEEFFLINDGNSGCPSSLGCYYIDNVYVSHYYGAGFAGMWATSLSQGANVVWGANESNSLDQWEKTCATACVAAPPNRAPGR